MSKYNKVNPGQYYVAGRLTPDEMARERMKQQRTPASTSVPPPAPAPAPARARVDAREAKVHSAKNQGKDGHIRGAGAPTRAAKAKAAGRTRGS